MIASMTGYGRGEVKKESKEIIVEVRSLNNRFLDISIRLPKTLSVFEEEARNIARQYLTRGRINIVINIKESNNDKNFSGKANLELAQDYLKQLLSLKKELNLSGKVKLEHLLAFSDIFLPDVDEDVSDKTWNYIKKALIKALEDLKKMRLSEGKELSADLISRIEKLDKNIKKIEKLSKSRTDKELIKLKERIANLQLSDELDEGRLELEIAILASKLDVTEECIRIKSHNKMFLEILSSDEPVGRKLNFLLQEMTRESNTIGAKACDAEISHLVIDIKEEVEKLREQVQNIE